MTIVAVDSCDIDPIVVDSVFLAVGERVNVLVTTDQVPGWYFGVSQINGQLFHDICADRGPLSI